MAPKNLSFKTAEIDEKSIRKENAEELVVALAEAKADAIMSRLKTIDHLEEITHPTLLITADTIFLPTSIGIEVAVYQGIIREKPSSYSGGQAAVVGSVVVTKLTKGIRKGAWERSEVYFHDIPDEVIDSLIEGIILNVACGLMLEHPLTLPFVDTLIGTADSIMGLPRSLTEKLIEDAL